MAFRCNLMTTLLVLLAAFQVPFEYGFGKSPIHGIDYFAEAWFLCDIFVQHYLGYTEPDPRDDLGIEGRLLGGTACSGPF